MANYSISILIVSLLIYSHDALPVAVTKNPAGKERLVINYLQYYGYLNKRFNDDDNQTKLALSALQKFHGIKDTGILDDATWELISKPRCGEKDMTNHLVDLRKEKPSGVITIFVGKWSLNLPKYRQKAFLIKILKKLENILLRKFKWSEDNEGDINFIFDKDIYYTNSNRPQAGHSLSRIVDIGGKYFIYIDSKATTSHLLFDYTVNHMIGHIFGMHHQQGDNIMNPVIDQKQINIKVTQNMFSVPCSTSIESVFSFVHDGLTYFFKDDKYWRISGGYQIDPGYPQSLQSKWQGVPANFDEVFVWGGLWYTYFFKGKYYYRYNSSIDRIDDGYPLLIRDGWKNVPDDIDAAFTDADYQTYFFKSDLIYKYDNAKKEVAYGYPKKISSVYPNVPNNLDSVVRYYYDGVIYFFRDYNFWRWDQKRDMAEGPFVINQGWKNLCGSSQSLQVN